MLVAIVDVETTGLNPETDAVIEVAAILYSTEHRAILQQVSTLLPVAANPAEAVNGISVDMVNENNNHAWGSQDSITDAIISMMEDSSYIVAFNSDFDQSFIETMGNTAWQIKVSWADAAAIQYPRQSTKRDLVNIAIANGVPVVNAHRALDDCRILADLLGKVPDLDEQLARAARSKATVKALVSYNQRDLAKAAGFIWDAIVARAWAKRMSLEDAEALPFPVEVVG
jgi:DNA polymerase-3 subunit epsilon